MVIYVGGLKMAISTTIFLFITTLTFIHCANDSRYKILSRKKRYLVFPEGSSLSIAICTTVQTGITPGEIFTEGVNWGISYDLPNETKAFKDLLDKPKAMMQSRHRRDLYGKIEKIMKSMGYDGRNCVLRALCESSRRFKIKGESLVDEILRIVFSYPKEYKSGQEEQRHYEYYEASEKGIEMGKECHEMFPECTFSLIDLALGYYSSFGYDPHIEN